MMFPSAKGKGGMIYSEVEPYLEGKGKGKGVDLYGKGKGYEMDTYTDSWYSFGKGKGKGKGFYSPSPYFFGKGYGKGKGEMMYMEFGKGKGKGGEYPSEGPGDGMNLEDPKRKPAPAGLLLLIGVPAQADDRMMMELLEAAAHQEGEPQRRLLHWKRVAVPSSSASPGANFGLAEFRNSGAAYQAMRVLHDFEFPRQLGGSLLRCSVDQATKRGLITWRRHLQAQKAIEISKQGYDLPANLSDIVQEELDKMIEFQKLKIKEEVLPANLRRILHFGNRGEAEEADLQEMENRRVQEKLLRESEEATKVESIRQQLDNAIKHYSAEFEKVDRERQLKRSIEAAERGVPKEEDEEEEMGDMLRGADLVVETPSELLALVSETKMAEEFGAGEARAVIAGVSSSLLTDLMMRVPRTADIFSRTHEINWLSIRSLLLPSSKFRYFLSGLVSQFFGGHETDIVEFILRKLGPRAAGKESEPAMPQDFMLEMRGFLEDPELTDLVVRIWRVFLFETLRQREEGKAGKTKRGERKKRKGRANPSPALALMEDI